MVRTLGVEREQFILRNGRIVPAIDELLPKLYQFCEAKGLPTANFGYELFAGQIEDRTSIEKSVSGVIRALQRNEEILAEVGAGLGLQFWPTDYATEEELGDLVVNGFSERHQQIWEAIPYERKVAASQVAAIHVHVSASAEEAVRVLNYCREDVIDRLGAISNESRGKRLAAYRAMAETYGIPPEFASTLELASYIEERGGERNVWDLIRYKPTTGTVEFRMFGTTASKRVIRQCVEEAQRLMETIL